MSQINQLLLGRQGTLRRDLFNLTRDLLVSSALSMEIRLRYGVGKPLRSLRADRFRTSDTLFILGSGSSINCILPSGFQHIARHDSIGLNHWPLHDFVPTFLMFEASSNRRRVVALLETLKLRAEAYRGVPLIVDYRNWRCFGISLGGLPSMLRDPIYFHTPWWLASTNPRHVSAGLSLWDHPLRRRLGEPWRLIHHRGGLSAAVSLACLAGYRQIVLAGVDLDDSMFFWETQPERYASLPIPERIEQTSVHSSVDPALSAKHHTLPMDDYLVLFRDKVLRSKQMELYTLNPNSCLAGRLPVYELPEGGFQNDIDKPRVFA